MTEGILLPRLVGLLIIQDQSNLFFFLLLYILLKQYSNTGSKWDGDFIGLSADSH